MAVLHCLLAGRHRSNGLLLTIGLIRLRQYLRPLQLNSLQGIGIQS